MNNRVFQLIEDKNMTQADFASKTGISPSALTQLKTKEGNLSMENVMKIKNTFPNLSLDWLILGKGSMYEQIFNSQSNLIFPEITDNQITPIPEILESNTYLEPPIIDYQKSGNHTISEKQCKEKEQFIEKTIEKNIERKIKKIIVFYDDGRFEELNQ